MNDKLLNDFKRWLNLKGYSNLTHYYNIRPFLREVGNNITKETIENFIIKAKKEKKIETVNSYIKAIRVFHKFLEKDIITPALYKREKKIPKYITLEYLKEEVMPVVKLLFPTPLRVMTILFFMFFTGLRKGEVIALKRKDFDLMNRTVKIFDKKQKEERIVFYPEGVQNLLELYFKTFPEKENAFNLSQGKVNYIFKQINENLPDINFHPHLLRHSFGVHTVELLPLDEVQELLGHKNIETTKIYTRRNMKRMKETYDKKVKFNIKDL